MLIIDLNCDLGESFGRYSLGQDEEVIRYISSGNVACGFHAGDPGVMRRTVELLAARNVAIGAHPGLPDLVGFGRRELAVEPEEVENLVIYQVGALKAFAESVGGLTGWAIVWRALSWSTKEVRILCLMQCLLAESRCLLQVSLLFSWLTGRPPGDILSWQP